MTFGSKSFEFDCDCNRIFAGSVGGVDVSSVASRRFSQYHFPIYCPRESSTALFCHVSALAVLFLFKSDTVTLSFQRVR